MSAIDSKQVIDVNTDSNNSDTKELEDSPRTSEPYFYICAVLYRNTYHLITERWPINNGTYCKVLRWNTLRAAEKVWQNYSLAPGRRIMKRFKPVIFMVSRSLLDQQDFRKNYSSHSNKAYLKNPILKIGLKHGLTRFQNLKITEIEVASLLWIGKGNVTLEQQPPEFA